MNKIEIYIKCAILIINIFLIENKKIFKNKRKYLPFIKNSYSKYKNGILVTTNRCTKNFKYYLYNAKKKDTVLNVFKNENITDNDSLNNFNKLLEWSINKKNEYINVKNDFNINDLINYFEDKLSLHNIKFIHENRNNYGYLKNKIKDFIIENKLEVNKNLELYLSKDNNVGNTNTDNEKTRKSDDQILCMKAKKKIRKSEIICSIPSSFIINFDHIINQIKEYVDSFSESYNVNYIKYIFKNNLEEQINELDSLTILKYDIYQKHTNFLTFIKSSNIYLKYWDIKLTLIITYIYFISKYINVLLYVYNFNNTIFHIMNNIFRENTNNDKTTIKNFLNNNLRNSIKNKRNDKNTNNKFYDKNNINIYDTLETMDCYSLNCINEINNILMKNIELELQNHKNFFFFKDYEFYINYIVNKKELNYLPLNFPDSSFFLFNNTNIRNIIYFRRQMIHELINLYKNDDENNNNFFFIDKRFIHKFLFSNNKYYHEVQNFKNNSIFKNNINVPLSKIESSNTIDVNKLYRFILLNDKYSNTVKHNINNDQKSDVNNEKWRNYNFNEESFNENNNDKCINRNFQYFINSSIYDSFIFDSFEEFFNYKFLTHVYSYICSHSIKIKNKVIFNKEEKKKKKEEENNNHCVLKDSILNSNIIMKHNNKISEKFYINECSKYNFNVYEKKEKEEENKYMCLIPLIDVCNHNSFYNNSIIKKDIKKRKTSYVSEDTKYNINKGDFSHPNSPDEKNDDMIKQNVINEVENENKTVNMSEAYKMKENMKNNLKDSIIESVEYVHLISTKNIEIDEEITVSYGNLSNDLLLLEYGFIDKRNMKVYFNFDVKIIREIILQILGFDKLPLIMLESLEKVKINLFKKLNVIPNEEDVYERFDTNTIENAKITRKKSEILNDYLRKNKYFNEYNIFKMKDRINKFFIDEKVQFHDKKNYLYIGGESVVDPILLATIRIIIYDDIEHLSKININDLLKWENYLSVYSEMIVLQVLIKLCDEIIYQQFYDINYEEIIKEGNIKYSNLKFLQNKFLQTNLFNSDKSINAFEGNNFNIIIHNIMKLKELQNAKVKLNEKFNQMKNLLKH
ncbi:conserved Plasmodium protein, unknown function [Plasmodium gallinaceum]|uniref:SET domain-containing protein n=1 Tax=Plasmodium gallinaceum TaxID=5849 RepID=A0A1J1GXZ0_PLAGA|nr:conserved Plasmodium protein, unknown function [Plasmodium gallinaceum]CRG97434.1 conserved Plasmodium protein, unknown function [Plasmodium gallinaceum]